MILSKVQAEGIYQSMCIANNLGGRINVTVGSHSSSIIKLETRDDGTILIVGDSPSMMISIKRELYGSQSAFAAAYELA